ncbi:MAG: 2Fe-2S ferredoxin [Devosia sp.]|uniref:DUF1284 domain-containing protein n=1 Tax=Devosia sp. TaxID=1871048 RepID=UPI00260FFF1E|nr:DUF1284 domain-containing protein [Devosia sp.]MDB5531447.1 2Fe-2S ferredoxin [Devosia sp.]
MTVRLRPHHLLCLLTYVGKGYTPAFVVNYDRIAKRLSAGEAIEIVAGPDDVCAPLLCEPEQHCWNDSVTERDRLAARDVGELLRREEPIAAGTRLVLDEDAIVQMRQGFATGAIRQACAGCEWSEFCTAIAAGSFEDVRVTMHC